MATPYLGNVPNRNTGAATFSIDTDYYHSWLSGAITSWNIDIAALNTNDTRDTSTTSVLIGSGSKSFTVSAGKSFSKGQWLTIAVTTSPTVNSMVAQVSSYSGTSLVVDVPANGVFGGGTFIAWTIALTGAPSTSVSAAMAPVTSAATTGAARVLLDAIYPAFGVYQSTAQAIAAATFTKVQLQTEEYDTANAFDSTTNYRFTPLVAGYYHINGRTAFASGQSSHVCSIYKNGTSHKRGSMGTLIASSVSTLVFMNGTTDYLELYVYQASGASQNLVNAGEETYFNATVAKAT